MDEQSGAKKAQVISNALSYYEHAGWNTDAVMVGDRKYDVIGAHEKGLAAIGVLYGYGDRRSWRKRERFCGRGFGGAAGAAAV